ncbi:hypothetical protein Plhal304r1_c040g0117801 [Plasmopara halstedii]
MVNLLCAIVGAASNAFEVNIDDTASVAALKKAVKAEKPNDMKGIDADKLELFLAKTNGGAWLDRAGAASVALDGRGDPRGYVQMDPTLWIKNPMYFGDNFRPAEGQIHVLVVVPSHVRAGIGVNPSKLLRYKKQDADAGSSLLYSSLFLFRLSFPALLCPTGKIQPTKKDV